MRGERTCDELPRVLEISLGKRESRAVELLGNAAARADGM